MTRPMPGPPPILDAEYTEALRCAAEIRDALTEAEKENTP